MLCPKCGHKMECKKLLDRTRCVKEKSVIMVDDGERHGLLRLQAKLYQCPAWFCKNVEVELEAEA